MRRVLLTLVADSGHAGNLLKLDARFVVRSSKFRLCLDFGQITVLTSSHRNLSFQQLRFEIDPGAWGKNALSTGLNPICLFLHTPMHAKMKPRDKLPGSITWRKLKFQLFTAECLKDIECHGATHSPVLIGRAAKELTVLTPSLRSAPFWPLFPPAKSDIPRSGAGCRPDGSNRSVIRDQQQLHGNGTRRTIQ